MSSGFVYAAGVHEWSALVFAPNEKDRFAPHSGEVVAALRAAQGTPKDAPLHLVTVSTHLGKVLIENLEAWENDDWVGVKGAEPIRVLVNELRQRCAPTTIRSLDGEDRLLRLPLALRRREDAMAQGPGEPVNLDKHPAFNITGAKLATLTQATAYRCLREQTAVPERPATTAIVAKVLTSLRGATSKPVDESDLWIGTRHKDFQRKVADFLWKGLHGAHRVGAYWSKMQGYETRGACATCGATESMEHILLNCAHNGQALVWRFAQNLWEAKGLEWHAPSFEDILGLGLQSREVLGPRPRTRACHARLWRILVSESVYLIWKLRCTRVIGHQDDATWEHSPEAIATSWLGTMNKRVRQDVASTSSRFGRSALKKTLVTATWEGVMDGKPAAGKDWTSLDWVLVGISPNTATPEGGG
ncbi:hypothetical protein FOMPIDRAFT_1135933 [Fomitopsis schrenkii]|uniref:Reverse transcriptase zinc-binding domain-containing protein n=1 Tax=Fomitopsis schrenkii TaxID=2126942 RepID=S8F3L3_FOMSC|nr:hypothetical protein FOMPIDRAFT_1135933 [Fomitopsis schrenkii]